MSTTTHSIRNGVHDMGALRSNSQKAEFKRQFWQYVSVRSQRVRHLTNTVENNKRLRGCAGGMTSQGRQGLECES